MAGRLMAEGKIEPMILVSPGAGGSLYVNSPVSGNWEDFLVRELVAHIDRTYRTIPRAASRGIAGHSVGGQNAMRLAMWHPDIFSAVYSLSGSLGLVDPYEDAKANALYWQLEASIFAVDIGAAFSPNPNVPAPFIDFPFATVDGEVTLIEEVWDLWTTGHPLGQLPQYLDNLRQLRGIRFDVGLQDHFKSIPPGNRAFAAKLTEAGIDHVFEEYEGDHGDRLASRLEQRVLPFFSEVLDARFSSAYFPRLRWTTPVHVVTSREWPTVLEVAVTLDTPLESSESLRKVIVDLSPLGISTPLTLTPEGVRYTGSTTVNPPLSGQYTLPILAEDGDGGRYFLSAVSLEVFPPGDLPIYGDELAPAWEVVEFRVEETDLDQAGMVYAGSAACSFQVKESFSGWRASFQPEEPFSAFGYETLHLAIHPGDAAASDRQWLQLGAEGGGSINLLSEGLVDLTRQEWQMVEVPVEAFALEGPASGFYLLGKFGGTFYVDDIYLATGTQRPSIPTAVVEEQVAGLPEGFVLRQNYPNPFNGETVIGFVLPTREEVELTVFDLVGQRVTTLVWGTWEVGEHEVRWDGRDEYGRKLASGVYLYLLRAGSRIEGRKLLLLE